MPHFKTLQDYWNSDYFKENEKRWTASFDKFDRENKVVIIKIALVALAAIVILPYFLPLAWNAPIKLLGFPLYLYAVIAIPAKNRRRHMDLIDEMISQQGQDVVIGS